MGLKFNWGSFGNWLGIWILLFFIFPSIIGKERYSAMTEYHPLFLAAVPVFALICTGICKKIINRGK